MREANDMINDIFFPINQCYKEEDISSILAVFKSFTSNPQLAQEVKCTGKAFSQVGCRKPSVPDDSNNDMCACLLILLQLIAFWLFQLLVRVTS